MLSTPSPTSTTRTATAFFATLHPWRELTNLSSFTRPISFGEATTRIKRNLAYFRVNYTIIILVILFLSLLWHPISMIVFLIILIAWGYLYLLREQPLVVLNSRIDDRVVLTVLTIVTIVALILTSVWLNVLVAIIIGFGVVLVHATFRGTDDLYSDEFQGRGDSGRLFSVVGGLPASAGYTRI